MNKKFCELLIKRASHQKGAALILALILFAVGSLMVVPLLSLMGSGFKATDRVYDQKAYELYAADAGVRDAVRQLVDNYDSTTPWTDVTADLDSTVNGKYVDYTIEYIEPSESNYVDEHGITHGFYRITSNAGETSGNPKTTITADVTLLDFFATIKGKNAITVANGNVLSSAGGQAAVAESVMGVNIELISGGENYTTPPIIAINGGGGSGASAIAVLNGGKVDHINVYPGSGYTTVPSVEISGGGGSNFAISVSLKVVDVNIINGGSGYESPPEVSFFALNGSGVTATATISSHRVNDVIIDSPGSGYHCPPDITFIGGLSFPAACTTVYGNVQLLGSGNVDIFYPEPVKLAADLPKNSTSLIVTSDLFDEYLLAGSLVLENTRDPNAPTETVDYNDKHDNGNGTITFTLVNKNSKPYLIDDNVYVTRPQDAEPPENWPSAGQVEAYYLKELSESNSEIINDPDTTIDVGTYNGPLMANNGDPTAEYTIDGTGTLDGVIFVDGDLHFDTGANITLGTTATEGQTIFVTGNVTMGANVTLNGPGAIIAIGDIDFQPNLGNESYIMVCSLDGAVSFQPQNGTVFHGSVAAAGGVNFLTNVTIDCSGAGFGLDTPGGDDDVYLGGFSSWIIK